MKIINETINKNTKGNTDILDITGEISKIVRKSGIKNGLCTVFSIGSTAGITTIEYEPGLLMDLPKFLDKIIPSSVRYNHDNTWGDGNGYAHLRSSLIKTSFSVPVMDGEPVLGTWQQIVFIDFDNRPRNRRIVVQLMGE